MNLLSIPSFSRYRHPAHERVCPHCHGPVQRVRRRFVDRVVSLLKPVQRYRCRARGRDCDWEGTLPY